MAESSLEKVKRLREITGVGFKDCKSAIDECDGDIDKSIEFLRKKGISKATKKMERVAADGLVLVEQKDNNLSILEVNCETDFVAKNNDFVHFVSELSKLNFNNFGQLDKLNNAKMINNITVKDNLVNLIAKMGEKITIRRTDYLDGKNSKNFFYIHSPSSKNTGKLAVLLSLEFPDLTTDLLKTFGHHLCMHIAAMNPISIDLDDLNNDILSKEKEIIKEELLNSGKDEKIIEKISKGKIKKFIDENTLLNQTWIMDPDKKVKDIMFEISKEKKLKVQNFIRFKVGEGIN